MESIDPFRSSVADHGRAEDVKPLGSLAQSARREELKWGRWVMTAIGVVFLALFGSALRNPPMPVPAPNAAPAGDDALVGPPVKPSRLAIGAWALLGAVLILGAPFLPRFPVPVVIADMVLSVISVGLAILNNPRAAKGGGLLVILLGAFLFWMLEVGRAFKRHQVKAAAGEALE